MPGKLSPQTCSDSVGTGNLKWQMVVKLKTSWHVFGRQYGSTFTFAPEQHQQNRHFDCQAVMMCKPKSTFHGPERRLKNRTHKIPSLCNEIQSRLCSHMDTFFYIDPFQQVSLRGGWEQNCHHEQNLFALVYIHNGSRPTAQARLQQNLPTQSKNARIHRRTGWGSLKFMWPADCHTECHTTGMESHWTRAKWGAFIRQTCASNLQLFGALFCWL